jgi:excisionase family DNA binding protein
VADAADALRISTKTVRRLIGRGELAASRVGRQLRVDPRDLHAFLPARLLDG